jgi:heme exporter protein C
VSPPDYPQGETVRIMYVHVPAAWMALFVYSVMALASAIALIFRHPLADVAAKTAAPIGAVFCFLSLATGSLWGKPMWGAWWVWDARLTSMFVLMLLYVGYMAIWAAIEEPHRAAMVARIVALVGFINVPIVKFSVDWWNSLHQPASVFRADGPTIAGPMLWPLLVMGLAYSFLFLALHLTAMRAEIAARKIRQIQIAEIGER